jgi:hypothetical protein
MNFATFLEGLSDKQLQSLNKLTEEMIQEKSESLLASEPETTNLVEQTNGDANPSVAEDFRVVRIQEPNNRKVPVKFKKNKWKDDGEFSDVETPQFEKTPRRRSKPNKRQVECHVCGKEFSINENLIYGEFHRCNRCTGR